MNPAMATSSIAENVARVQERIASAARRAGRSSQEIALMAVTKTVDPERIQQAYASGVRLLGENRVQEFEGKLAQLAGLTGAEWRLIGHLQSNKATKAAELFAGVDSIDSLRLAEKLDAAARSSGKNLRVLIEINIAGEASKQGIAPGSAELEQLLLAAPSLPALRIRGLMTVPPFAEDPESVRPYFRHLRELRDEIAKRGLPALEMEELSMGMSHDFEVAIEEGSTCVRIGTAIFGARPKP
jgi:pyridoxal phosphate enzyme (YggS family)